LSTLFFDVFTHRRPSLTYSQLLWITSKQKQDYLQYHDFILLDATYVANKHDFPLVIVSTLDQNGRVLLLCQCITTSETTIDYKWILRMYMELTEAPEPKVIMTDRAPAILSAVHSELPNTIHLCCQFHLYGNLKQQSLKFHLDPLAASPSTNCCCWRWRLLVLHGRACQRVAPPNVAREMLGRTAR